ncbi:protein fam79a [Echinococcus multilocularis]|uniref:Protein fam79a n=1 Tax=Echinococcus multilocularis TaxID=6211 RepID=A0A068XZQ1_ECHMU|nr:protein fam79a [Echinococcus multilocularis]
MGREVAMYQWGSSWCEQKKARPTNRWLVALDCLLACLLAYLLDDWVETEEGKNETTKEQRGQKYTLSAPTQLSMMNFTEVLKKIPTPQINLPNVQLPTFGKDANNGKAPLNMTKEDMEQLITTIQHTTLAAEDGAFVALWILTLIDHWNNEHERIVVLTERSFYIIRYDFLSGHIRESKRVGLGQLISVTTGPLVFPTKSLMPTRTSPGVQLVWGDLGSVTAAQKWNPLCRNMPYVVLTHHPLLVKQNKLPSGQANANGAGYGHDTNAGTLYDVNNFLKAIRDACSASNVEFKTGDITIESYGNIGSVVFNQTSLGFTRSKTKNFAFFTSSSYHLSLLSRFVAPSSSSLSSSYELSHGKWTFACKCCDPGKMSTHYITQTPLSNDFRLCSSSIHRLLWHF